MQTLSDQVGLAVVTGLGSRLKEKMDKDITKIHRYGQSIQMK